MKKQDEQRLVPKLRFKGFSEDWEQRELHELVNFSKGKGYSKKDIVESGTPFIRYGSLYTNFEIEITNIKESVEENSKSVKSKGGEILIPSSGETPSEIARASTLLKKDVLIGGDINILTVKNNNVLPTFLALDLNTNRNSKELSKYAVGNSVVHLYNKDLHRLKIYLPDIETQKQIVRIWRSLDKLLTLHKRKLEVLKVQKNIYLNKMFASKYGVIQLRFKGFTEHWEQRELGEVFKYEQPTKYLVTSTDYSDEYCTPVLTAGQSFILGYTDDTEGIKKASKTNPVVIFDDFTTGNHYVDFPFKIKSSALKILSISDKSYDDYFTFYSLNRIKYSPQNHQRHWISIFSRIKVHMPTISEQVSIGNLLRTIDNMITLHNEKLNKLKSLKQEYLNYLFI